jgi:hypothetical protein
VGTVGYFLPLQLTVDELARLIFAHLRPRLDGRWPAELKLRLRRIDDCALNHGTRVARARASTLTVMPRAARSARETALAERLQELRELRELREPRELRELREPRELRELRERRAEQEPPPAFVGAMVDCSAAMLEAERAFLLEQT